MHAENSYVCRESNEFYIQGSDSDRYMGVVAMAMPFYDDELMLDKLNDAELFAGLEDRNPEQSMFYDEEKLEDDKRAEQTREGLSSVAEVPPVLR